MTDALLGEVRLMPFAFAPKGWALCHGQLLPIYQYAALFAVIGTTYGGNGQVTFALPDLQGRTPVGAGGSESSALGQKGGATTTTLGAEHLPGHTHLVRADAAGADALAVTASAVLGSPPDMSYYTTSPTPLVGVMAPQMVAPSGGGQPFSLMQPYLVLNFCIALSAGTNSP